MPAKTIYDDLGIGYTRSRQADPRLAGVIWAALGDAETVVNIGAGAGAYEPADRQVVALEPSKVMIAQRPTGAPRAVQGRAEHLPFPDKSFDAAMAILSDHHWQDRQQAFRELRRVARKRIVLFNANPAEAESFWLTSDYLPEFLELIPDAYRAVGTWQRELEVSLGRATLRAVPIPHDCSDGFYGAFWRRPHAYLDPTIRAGISVFARLGAAEVSRAMQKLRSDLDSGAWGEQHRDLRGRSELHLGYYLIVAEVT